MSDITDKMQRVLQTMTNDDTSVPRSPNRDRFVERSNLLLECIAALDTSSPCDLLVGSEQQLKEALEVLYRCGQKQGWQTAYESEMEMARAALSATEAQK